MVDLAVQLITQKSAPFRPEKFEDHYQTALRELVQEKLKGHKIIAAPEAAPHQGWERRRSDGRATRQHRRQEAADKDEAIKVAPKVRLVATR